MLTQATVLLLPILILNASLLDLLNLSGGTLSWLALLGGIAGSAVEIVLFLFVLYSLLLLAASLRKEWKVVPTAATRDPKLVVLIPAHNEEQVIGKTLASFSQQAYPEHLREVLVIADNCTDTTAELSRLHGATVWERNNLSERGKGYALAWACSRLLAERPDAEAIVIVDADTWAAPDFLATIARRLRQEALGQNKPVAEAMVALQGRYGVLNQADGWRAALTAAAFELFNHVRLLGAEHLGLAVNLKGNGMAFTRAVTAAVPWEGRSITEDVDYGLNLLMAGVTIHYAYDAEVLAEMPVTGKQAASQRARWEGGRFKLLRERALPLLKQAIRKRDIRLADAALGLIIPPLAELSSLVALGIIGGTACLFSPRFMAPGAVTNSIQQVGLWILLPAAAAAVGLTIYVLVGLRVAGAKKEAYAALLRAPFYIAWKFALYIIMRFQRRKGSSDEWVRTARIGTGH